MKHLIRVAAFAVCTALAAPVGAQDLNAGFTAYRAGDYATALENWRPLAEDGDATAQVSLGRMYSQGHGVPQDYAEAVRWYRLAAEQGDAWAQDSLGVMYSQGHGVPQDYAEAVRWYRLAAEQGNATAQSNLGTKFEEGRGAPQDYVSAHMWYNIASANGHESAAEWRDELAQRMTPDQIAEAQARARTCMASDYQDCD
jgi:TPR repeat protein